MPPTDHPFANYAAGIGFAVGAAGALLTAWADLPNTGPEGGWLWARVLGFAVVLALLAYMAGALHDTRLHWENTLCSIGDGVLVIDKGGRVVFLNPAAEGMTGWSGRDARRKAVEAVLKFADEKTGESLEVSANALLKEGKVHRANKPKLLVSRDGHRVLVEESSAPIRDRRGKVTGGILVFRDVSARREVQDYLSQSQKMDALGRLANGAAGDFNNLLTVITGFSEMLRADLAEGNHLRRFADEIHFAADRAAGLARQLLSLGQRQTGSMKVQDLNALVLSMDTMLRRLVGGKIDVEFVTASAAAWVKADAAQMEQVLVNLAMNSRDAMPHGGKFVVEISSMDIDESQTDKWPGLKPGGYVTMAVSDTGTGMDAETREHLFEPFFTTKTKDKGTGLGLSIVYGIVQQSGGYLNVYSQLGAGTIFEIYLPRAKSAAENLFPRESGRIPKGCETVLIADDEDGVRKLIHSVLAANGYLVLEAIDGAAALSLFEANRGQVDLVVTDIVMPNLNGLDLGDRIRELEPEARILYISGFRDSPPGGPADRSERIFLNKPFAPNELLAKVREVLDRPMESHSRGAEA